MYAVRIDCSGRLGVVGAVFRLGIFITEFTVYWCSPDWFAFLSVLFDLVLGDVLLVFVVFVAS